MRLFTLQAERRNRRPAKVLCKGHDKRGAIAGRPKYRQDCNGWHEAHGTSNMSAFRESVESMIPALRRYARALARDTDIADDLVQDTLVRALRSEKLFIGGDLRSWLYTILTNLNRNRRRSLARKPVFTELFDNNPDASGTEAEGRDISRALAALVEEQRSVLLLVMLEGLSYREVADIQGVPIGTVMSRLARARAHVKAYLDGERPALRAVK
jgi:RNA polymerase sigma-70 factor (ECF subfamily)